MDIDKEEQVENDVLKKELENKKHRISVQQKFIKESQYENVQKIQEIKKLEQQVKELQDENFKKQILINGYQKRTGDLEITIVKQQEKMEYLLKFFDSIKSSINAIKRSVKPLTLIEKIASKFTRRTDKIIDDETHNANNILDDIGDEIARSRMENSEQQSTEEFMKEYVKANYPRKEEEPKKKEEEQAEL